MSRFLGSEAFAPGGHNELQLLPLRFGRLEPGRVAAAKLSATCSCYPTTSLRILITLNVHPGDGLYERAYEKLLISRVGDTAWPQILAMRLRSRMAYLSAPTALHIFVVRVPAARARLVDTAKCRGGALTLRRLT